MNRLPICTAIAALALVPLAAFAQDAPPPPLFGGGIKLGGPMMLNGGNTLLPLLKRSDVQSNIALSLKQKNELNEILNGPQRITVSLVDHGDKSEADRQKEIEKQVADQIGGPEEKLKAVLKPEQFTRLQQLQLQWKGLLILADQKIADRVKISSEARPGIAKAAADYNTEKQQVMQSLMQVDNRPEQDGNNIRVARMVKMNMEALENPLSPEYKRLSAAKATAEKQILEALTPEDRAAWKKAQGELFTFRTDLKGNRF